MEREGRKKKGLRIIMIRNKEGSDEKREGYLKGEDGFSGKAFLLNVGKRKKNMQGGECFCSCFLI